ncbi:MAG: lipid-A-disaccharide synthase [Pseudomonadota bacterium]
MTTVLLTAAEPSGDAMGASLMRVLRELRPGVRFIGAGGSAMRAEGLIGDLPTEQLAVMGPVDALKALPRARTITRGVVELCSHYRPDVAVFIDSWSFSKMVAEKVKAVSPSTKLVKLAAPQVWASRPKRAKMAAELFDVILCLLPFEPALFAGEGGAAQFIGNPNFQETRARLGAVGNFRERHNLTSQRLLLILPGSRRGEVKRLMPVFGATYAAVRQRFSDVRGVVVAAQNVAAQVQAQAEQWEQSALIVPGKERFDAFHAADVALAASGTVTTELALAHTPMVTAYRLGPLTAFWAKRVMITPYISVLNVAAGEEIIPERVQSACTAERLTAELVLLLSDENVRARQISAFETLLPQLLGTEDPSRAAARAILALIDGEDGGDLDSSAAG